MYKNLLIISGGIEAVPGIIHAKKLGYSTVVLDGNQNAPGFKHCDHKIISSTYDVKDSVRKSLLFHHEVKKINGVISIASDVPLTVSTISKRLGIPNISIDAAKLSSDKLAMKNKFKKDLLPIPRFKEIKTKKDLYKITKNWDFPLVLKPIDSRGSRGVLLIDKKVNLDWAFEHSLENSNNGKLMIEEFIDGPQLSTESIMYNNECYTIAFSDRNYEHLKKFSPHIIENGGDMPSLLNTTLLKKVHNLIKQSAISLGANNCVVKGDIVIKDGQPYIIEIALRLSGGYFSTTQIPISTGVDLIGNAIKLACGEKINTDALIPKHNYFLCTRYFFPQPGRLKKILGHDIIARNKHIKHFQVFFKDGDQIKSPTAHTSRVGMIIAQGDSRDKAKKNAKEAINSLIFEYDK